MNFNYKNTKKNLPILLLLVFISLNATLFIFLAQDPRLASKQPKLKDGEENLAMAYNTFKYGVFSDSLEDKPNPSPANRREPLYPLLLTGGLHQIIEPEQISLQCLLSAAPSFCLSTLKKLKLINVVLLLTVTLAAFLSAKIVVGGNLVPVIAAALSGANPSLFLAINDFYSDLLASLFCLIVSTGLYLTINNPAHKNLNKIALKGKVFTQNTWINQVAAVVSGLALGCLILVKAVFIYAGAFIAVAFIGISQRMKSWQPIKRGIVVLLVAYLLVGGWITRNYMLLGDARVAGRDGEILAIRAEFSSMTWKEYSLSFCAFTPLCASTFLRQVDPLTYAHFNSSKYSFYARTKKRIAAMRQVNGSPSSNQADVDETLFQDAITLIRQNWLKHLALTLTFAYRGMQAHFLYFMAFCFFVVVAIRTQHYGLFLFLILSIYSVFIHAFASHYIERYSVPIIPSLSILLAPLVILLIQYIRENLNTKLGS